MNTLRFAAKVTFNAKSGNLKPCEVEALKKAFDDQPVASRVIGRKAGTEQRTIREWLKQEFHDSLEIRFNREKKSNNESVGVSILLGGQQLGYTESVQLERMQRGNSTGEPAYGRDMLKFVENNVGKWALWNEVVVEKYGWNSKPSPKDGVERMNLFKRFDALKDEYAFDNKGIPFPVKPAK